MGDFIVACNLIEVQYFVFAKNNQKFTGLYQCIKWVSLMLILNGYDTVEF